MSVDLGFLHVDK